MGEEGHLYSLKWNNYVSHVMASLNSMRTDRDLIDVTLSCEGKKILAHKMLLSACSPYFKDLFKENPCQHPVIIFRHIPFGDLTALVQFMYTGEVSVDEDELPSFLQTAEMLEIQGLTKGSQPVEKTKNDKTVPVQPKSAPSIVPTTVAETADFVPEPAQVAEKPKTRSESAASPSRKRRRTTPTRPEKELVQPKEPVITPEFVTSKVKVEAIETDDLPILEEHEFMSYDDGDDDDGDRGENLEYENNDLDGTEVSEGDPSDIQDKEWSEAKFEPMPPKPRSLLKIIKVKGGYKCGYCERAYSAQCSVYRHMKVHTGETACNICMKVFSSVELLQSHKYFHYGETICIQCRRAFTTALGLQRHLRQKTCVALRKK